MYDAPLIERGIFVRGRFEGTPVNRAPAAYLRWLLEHDILQFDEEQELRREIERRRGWHQRARS